jgi:hypothetical protein
MAALNVSVYVSDVHTVQVGNAYTQTVVLAQGDASGLTSLTLTFSGTGTPRYPAQATGTLVLP